MKLFIRTHRLASSAKRRGAALLLSLLILFVLVAIVFQISIGTTVDSRVARNDIALTKMDQSIESAMQEVFQLLIADAEGAAASEEEGDAGDAGFGEGADAGGLGEDSLSPDDGEGDEGGAVDSRRDEYMRPARTEINGMQLRIQVVDEDSKFNVLLLASEDELEADFAKEQLIRLLDLCREDTEADIDRTSAEEMAEDIYDHMRQRQNSILADPVLITTNPENEDLGFPLSVREFAALKSFNLGMFRDFRDSEGNVVHSLSTFLTVWTSLTSASAVLSEMGGAVGTNLAPGDSPPEDSEETGGEGANTAANGGGFAVNINTAPVAVLKCLFEDRDVPLRFWDDVVEYRNLEEKDDEEENSEEEEQDPPLDEFGEEIIERKIFDDLGELAEVDSFERLDDEMKPLVESRLRTTSDVYSIYITARRTTAQEDAFQSNTLGTKRERREQEIESGSALLRTVRAVVWRREGADGEIEIVPLIRWEVLDYVPFEISDYPDDER